MFNNLIIVCEFDYIEIYYNYEKKKLCFIKKNSLFHIK